VKPGTRLHQNVQRIDHIVFVYASRARLDEVRAKLDAVLGLDPDDWEDPIVIAPPQNCITQLCWSAGIELICPVPGREDEPWAGAQTLATRGEGLGMIAFGVADLHAANARARAAGFPIVASFSDPRHPDPPEERPGLGLDTVLPAELVEVHGLLRESVIAPFDGTGLYFAQVEPR
jgi:hypothetical protein